MRPYLGGGRLPVTLNLPLLPRRPALVFPIATKGFMSGCKPRRARAVWGSATPLLPMAFFLPFCRRRHAIIISRRRLRPRRLRVPVEGFAALAIIIFAIRHSITSPSIHHISAHATTTQQATHWKKQKKGGLHARNAALCRRRAPPNVLCQTMRRHLAGRSVACTGKRRTHRDLATSGARHIRNRRREAHTAGHTGPRSNRAAAPNKARQERTARSPQAGLKERQPA